MKVSSPKLILLLYFLYIETYKGKVYGDHVDDGGDFNKDKSRCGFKKPDKKRWKLIEKRIYKEKSYSKWYKYMYDKSLDKNFGNKDKNIETNRYLNAYDTSIGTVDIDVYWHIIHKISQEGKVYEKIYVSLL